MQTVFAILPAIAFALFALVALAIIARSAAGQQTAWQIPAALSAAFLAWSLYALASEGLLGLWRLFSATAWGNQVGFDLLFSIGTAFALLQPRMRAVGMHPVPWLVAILLSGSIALLALLARCLYLEQGKPRA